MPVEALNLKSAAFFLAFVLQCVKSAQGSVALQFMVLNFGSFARNTLADIVVAVAADSIQEGATARPSLIRRLRKGSRAVMIALGIGLALVKRCAT